MKTPKTWRLSARTIEALAELRDLYPSWTETELVEAAIEQYAFQKRYEQEENAYHDRMVLEAADGV